MSHVIDAGSAGRRALWLLSFLIGVPLLLHTTNLQTEFIAFSRSARPNAAPLVAMTCRIPDKSIAPEISLVARDIARRFHLAQSAAFSITHEAFRAARLQGVDPLLVLAVAAVESKFRPHARNPATGATGLMQVVPKWHLEEITDVGGEPSLTLIAPNISVGTAILADYLDAEGGDLEGALGHYLGTGGADHYLNSVRYEMAHLAKVLKST